MTCTWCGWTPHPVCDSFQGNPQRAQAGIRLPSDYKDDIIGIFRMAPCTTRLLKSLDEHLEWARMIIKAAKSKSLLIRNGIPEIRNIHSMVGQETAAKPRGKYTDGEASQATTCRGIGED